MPSRKKLTIGITINLENYENLRLEVDGEVNSVEDADDLIEYLDQVLARVGRADPDTGSRIDSYRRRVLENPDNYIEETDAAPEVAEAEPSISDEGKKTGAEPESAAVPETTPEPERTTDATSGEKKADESSCSECGAPISKSEAQLSQLFMGKMLCKKCLDKLQG